MKTVLNLTLVFASVLGVGFAAKAGVRDIGNGGNVVICYDAKKKIKSIELFDYYEARTKRNITLALGSPSLAVDQKVDLVLSRLHRLNPNREALYRKWHARFFQEASIQNGIDLIPLPDVGVGVIPKGCEVKQVAGQQAPVFPGDTRYVINGDLWKLMDNTTKAGLIVHELILREATSAPNNHTTSSATRYFHSQLASDAIKNLNLRQYIALLILTSFRSGDAQGGVVIALGGQDNDIKVVPPEFYTDDLVKSGVGRIDCDGYWAEQKSSYKFQGQVVEFCNEWSEFYSSGQLKQLSDRVNSQPLKFINNFYVGELTPQNMSFYADGSLESIDLPKVENPGKSAGKISGMGFDLKIGERLSLHPNGVMNWVSGSGTWTYNGKTARIIPPYLEFLESGLPKSIRLEDPLDLPTGDKSFASVYRTVRLYPNGLLMWGTLAADYSSSIWNQKIDLVTNSEIRFSEDGKFFQGFLVDVLELNLSEQKIRVYGNISLQEDLVYTFLAEDMKLKMLDGSLQLIRKDAKLKIHPNGRVEHWL